jgi:glycosyltransferase involved in cell wall biosynthesis
MDATVILLTYNHERFLAQAIGSVLAQQTRAPFELLISEDCSTDATREVIEQCTAQHRDRVRVFQSQQNLGSNEVTLRALRQASGRYVAFLDGDDYWTSSQKLQRQVDFLDEHLNCAMCFHNAMMFWDDGAAPPREYTPSTTPKITELQDLVRGNYIAGCSAMIRREVLANIPDWYEHAAFGDWPLYVFAAQQGSVGFLPEAMGAYRLHNRGLWSSATATQQLEGFVQFYNALAAHLGSEYRSHINQILASRYCELGMENRKAGRYAEALECFVKSLRLRPFSRGGVPGRCLWHMGRLAMPAFAARSLTLKQAACIIARSGRLPSRTKNLEEPARHPGKPFSPAEDKPTKALSK